MPSDIKIRPAVGTDVPFVADSWLESFRMSHAAGPVPMDLYWPLYREIIARALQRPNMRCLIACNPEDESQIYGYLCHEVSDTGVPVIFYCFTKQVFRRVGVQRALFEAAGIKANERLLYCFKTPMGGKVAQKLRGATWDPLYPRFLRPKKETHEAPLR